MSGPGTEARGSAGVYQLPGPMLRRRAVRQPDEPAYARRRPDGSAHESCGFAELDRRARAVAVRLGGALPPGSRVLLAYPQGADLAGAFFGCLYAGMTAVPLVLAAADGVDRTGTVAEAVDRCGPSAVLTGGDAWTALAVDRTRTQVVEADGKRVGGEAVWRLAETWRPVGVLRTAAAYQRYVADGLSGGRLEPALAHGHLAEVTAELTRALRLGASHEGVGWIAAVHGMDDAVWRALLPVYEGRVLREDGWGPTA